MPMHNARRQTDLQGWILTPRRAPLRAGLPRRRTRTRRGHSTDKARTTTRVAVVRAVSVQCPRRVRVPESREALLAEEGRDLLALALTPRARSFTPLLISIIV